MTLWHAGTLLIWLVCWHSRQTHGTGNQWWHTTLNLGRLCWHTQDDVVSLWWWCVCWFNVDVVIDVFSESEQAGNQSTLRKLAQPHKPKINPNFEIWTILDNFENFETILIILCLSMIEHSADISVEPPCVTYENCQGKNHSKTPT